MEKNRSSSFGAPNMLVSSPYMPSTTDAIEVLPPAQMRDEKSDIRVVPHFDNDRTSSYNRKTPQSSPQIPRKSSNSASSPMSPSAFVRNIFAKSPPRQKDPAKEYLYGSPKIGLMSDHDA